MYFLGRCSQRVFFLAVITLLALVLSGCASQLSARVTSFEQWPSDVVGATYRIQPNAQQENNLEFQAYADMVRAAIGATGLIEAQTDQAARFIVEFDYSNPESQVWVQEFADPFMYGGPWPMYSPWGAYYGGYYGGWGGGFMMTPPVVNTPVEVYKNTLTLTIQDSAHDNKQVYQSTAVNQSSSDNLFEVMPYLVRAVFDGFPGRSGEVREVNYPLPQ